MSEPTLSTFLHNILQADGLSKPSRFICSVTNPPGLSFPLMEAGYLDLLCHQAELPGVTLATSDIKIYGPSSKFPYQRTYSDLTLSFYVTNAMLEKQFFDAWMQVINPLETFDFAYKTDYITTISVFQFDELGNVTYAVDFLEAYPIAVDRMGLDWSQDGFHQLPITFAYRYWQPQQNGLLGAQQTLNGLIARGDQGINDLLSSSLNLSAQGNQASDTIPYPGYNSPPVNTQRLTLFQVPVVNDTTAP